MHGAFVTDMWAQMSVIEDPDPQSPPLQAAAPESGDRQHPSPSSRSRGGVSFSLGFKRTWRRRAGSWKRRCSTSCNATTTNPSISATKPVKPLLILPKTKFFDEIYLWFLELLILPRWTHVERVKVDAVKSAARVADLLVATVDGGVQELYINERRIEFEARALLATIARFKKQTDQWLAATNAINSVLKVYSPPLYLLFF